MAIIVFSVILGAPFALIAFKFTSLTTTRTTFLIVVVFSIILAVVTQNTFIFWIPLAVITAAVGARCNALQVGQSVRLLFTFLPMLALLSIPYFAIKGGSALDRIFICAAEGRIDELRDLIVKGEKVDSIDYRGATPLFYAARNGQVEVVDYLLKNGASTTIKLSGGSTPEAVAAKYGHRKIAEMIRRCEINRLGNIEARVRSV